MTIILLLLVNVFQIASTVLFVRRDNFEIRYTVNFRNFCQTEKDRFQFLLNVAISECVKECGARVHCKSLNYRSRINACELFSTATTETLSPGDCIHVAKQDIAIIKTPCNPDCKYGEVCVNLDGTGTCKIKECVNITDKELEMFMGNRKEVGKRMIYKGKNSMRGTIIECLETGLWSGNLSAFPSPSPANHSVDNVEVVSSTTMTSTDMVNSGATTTSPPPTIGRNCTNNSECIETDGTCIFGKCFCSPLYRYNETLKDCEKVCETMTTEFELFESTMIKNYNDIVFRETVDTIDECRVLCLLDSNCLVFETWLYLGHLVCNRGSVTFQMILDADPEIILYGTNTNLYSRICNKGD